MWPPAGCLPLDSNWHWRNRGCWRSAAAIQNRPGWWLLPYRLLRTDSRRTCWELKAINHINANRTSVLLKIHVLNMHHLLHKSFMQAIIESIPHHPAPPPKQACWAVGRVLTSIKKRSNWDFASDEIPTMSVVVLDGSVPWSPSLCRADMATSLRYHLKNIKPAEFEKRYIH